MPGTRGPSARLVARQVSELTMPRWLRWKALVPDGRLSIIVFDSVLSASIAHRPFRDPETGHWIGIEDVRLLGRPVNGTAIAHSMRIPHTTIRRQAADLVDARLLARDPEGFRIAEHLFVDGTIGRIAAADADDLMCGLRAMAKANYAPACAAIDANVAALPAGVVARLLVAFALRAMETVTELYEDFAIGTIMAGIISANIHHITSDAQLSQRFASEDTPPPDELRRPIALRALARDLGIPFETIRRRVAKLTADGRAQWRGDGVVVPTSVLLSEEHLDNNRRINLHFDQMLAALASLAMQCPR